MYRFRLQRVLDYRRRRVERLTRELQLLQGQLQQEESRLESLRGEGRACQEQLDATQGTVLRREELHMMHLVHRNLLQQMEAQEATTAQIEAAMTATRQALIVAQQEEKTMEKLREKQERRYVLEQARHEQSLFDSIAITRSRYEH